MNIYVGNLSFESGEEEVRQAFAAFGNVASVAMITDKETGKPRGFGFVEMPNAEEARAAIAGLNGKEFKGRPWTVNEARPRAEREGFGGGGGGFRRGGPGGGGGFGRPGGGKPGGNRGNTGRRSW
jgi:RNA recognition motif-containing protein